MSSSSPDRKEEMNAFSMPQRQRLDLLRFEAVVEYVQLRR
jgi:hypothetical protein